MPYPSDLWRLAKQVGVDHAVSVLPIEPPAPGSAPTAPRSWEKIHGLVPLEAIARDAEGAYPWDYASLQAMQARYAAAGLRLGVIESSPPMERVRPGLPGRDEEIEQIQVMLRAMGRLGIGAWCYNFMAAASWGRTSTTTPTRRRAGDRLRPGTGAAAELARRPHPHARPVVGQLPLLLGVRVVPRPERPVCAWPDPDDPPVAWMGPVPRLFHSVEQFQQALDLVPSPANALTLCQGNFALLTDDLPGVIEQIGGQGKIAFVHLRDVRGTVTRFV